MRVDGAACAQARIKNTLAGTGSEELTVKGEKGEYVSQMEVMLLKETVVSQEPHVLCVLGQGVQTLACWPGGVMLEMVSRVTTGFPLHFQLLTAESCPQAGGATAMALHGWVWLWAPVAGYPCSGSLVGFQPGQPSHNC